MSDQEQRDGGFFVVREGMAINVTIEDLMSREAWRRWTHELVAAAVARARAEDAGDALCSNRGPTSRPIDIRTPAVARREDEIDILVV